MKHPAASHRVRELRAVQLWLLAQVRTKSVSVLLVCKRFLREVSQPIYEGNKKILVKEFVVHCAGLNREATSTFATTARCRAR